MGAVSAALILAGCSANQQPVNQYTISGQVEGLADSTYLILDPVSHEAEKPLAEAMVLNGKFCFTDTISEPVAVYLRVKDTYSHFPLMVHRVMFKSKEAFVAMKAVEKQTMIWML